MRYQDTGERTVQQRLKRLFLQIHYPSSNDKLQEFEFELHFLLNLYCVYMTYRKWRLLLPAGLQ